MDVKSLTRWIEDYVGVFAACARGQQDVQALLDYWGVPLLLATKDGFVPLESRDEVAATAMKQVDRLRAADYDHTELIRFDVTSLEQKSAWCQGEFSWQREDGDEIARPTVTFLIGETPAGPRIAALLPHHP
jgi:hypothetical protein